MGPNRSRFDIIAAILISAMNKWATKTQIMYKANLSFKQLQKYMKFLMSSGLIRVSDTNRGRHFRTTPKGIRFLKDYEKICSYFQSITEEELYEESEPLKNLSNYTNT